VKDRRQKGQTKSYITPGKKEKISKIRTVSKYKTNVIKEEYRSLKKVSSSSYLMTRRSGRFVKNWGNEKKMDSFLKIKKLA